MKSTWHGFWGAGFFLELYGSGQILAQAGHKAKTTCRSRAAKHAGSPAGRSCEGQISQTRDHRDDVRPHHETEGACHVIATRNIAPNSLQAEDTRETVNRMVAEALEATGRLSVDILGMSWVLLLQCHVCGEIVFCDWLCGVTPILFMFGFGLWLDLVRRCKCFFAARQAFSAWPGSALLRDICCRTLFMSCVVA